MEPKFGVALTKCYYCGDDDGIILNKLLTQSVASKVEEMHGKVIDMEPCSKCKDWMRQGIILITIDAEKSKSGWNIPPVDRDKRKNWMPNPYRTGGLSVVKDEACKRIFPPEMFAHGEIHRFMFIEHEAAVKLGILPEEKTNDPRG